VLQEQLRAEAPDVPRLVPAPDRAGRGKVACACSTRSPAKPPGPPRRSPGCWPCRRHRTRRRALAGRQPRPVRPSDIAVLCRKRSQFPALRRALEARGIPVEVVGLGGLLTVPEVQDVVATLRVLNDAAASDALVRLLTGPRWRIGRGPGGAGRRARSLADRTAWPCHPSQPRGRARRGAHRPDHRGRQPGRGARRPGEPAAYSAAGYTRFRALAAELRTLRASSAAAPDLIGEVERTLGLDIEIASRPGADPLAAHADLDAFTDAADAFAGRGRNPPRAFLLPDCRGDREFGLETGRVGETDS